MAGSFRMPRLASILALAAALLLAACGGGGGSDEDVGVQGAISGNAIKGPVAGATVRALAISGGLAGAAMASATTDENGAFAMALGDYAGPVLLQVSGGQYVDEATGATMTMVPGDTLTAVLPAIVPGTATSGVQVTPLTGMAQSMAAGLPGGLSVANIVAANAAVGRYFMVDDILHTRPIDPLAPGSAAGASQAMVNYGMVLAGISQFSRDMSIPVSSRLAVALMNDARDGVMDGLAGDATLTILRAPLGGGLPRADAGSTGLAAAMQEFMASPLNRSGAAPAAVAPLVQQLGTLGGRLH